MKKFRKAASLLLALTLALALAIPAMAGENGEGTETPPAAESVTGTITLDNPEKDRTYTAYKIFDVVYGPADDPENFAYSIKENSEWFEVVAAYMNGVSTGGPDDEVLQGGGLTLTKAATGDTYVVEVNEDFSASAFADYLKANLGGKSGGKDLSASGEEVSISGLELGYYFVTSNNGALCNLTTTTPTATIHDKNKVEFDKKEDVVSVEIGQTVNYVIETKVPDTTGYSSYTFKISDKMSAGLTFQKDVKVYVGGTSDTTDAEGNVTPGEDGTELADTAYALTQTDDGFELTFNVFKDGVRDETTFPYGQLIKVKYSAIVNENAVAKIEKNNATLDYSNNPSDSTSTDQITDEEPVYSAEIEILKHETGAEDKVLAGAEFVLRREKVGEDGEPVKDEKGEAVYEYYFWNEADKKVEWKNSQEEATVKTTGEDGKANFIGLKDGKYQLIETKAPTGYNILTGPVDVEIKDGNTMYENPDVGEVVDKTPTEGDGNKLKVEAKVGNSTGTQLPSTGGIGTTIFYVVGGVLVIGAGILLVTKKRMSSK